MINLTRRAFLTGTTLAGLDVVLHRNARANNAAKRRMTIDLACGRIGVRAGLAEAIDLAARHGFESIEANAGQLSKLPPAELDDLLRQMKQKQLVFGAAGLTVNFRGDESSFSDGMKQLPATAALLKRAGVSRMGTWITPCHAKLTYVKNFRQHANRLRAVAQVLGEHNLRLGLEYVGPKTSWTARLFPFIHTMAEMKDLIAEIGCNNVGFVLDSWHWYTAHETEADLLSLTNDDIVAVDLNDAPTGLDVDEQKDSRRELPCATGVIDVETFLRALRTLNYDGPVRAEPFNAALKRLPPEEAVAATAAAMHKAFALLER